MEPAAMETPALADNPAASRYELRLGDGLAGFAEYRLSQHGTVISLGHTEIGPDFQGAGLAARLARFALDDARERGLAVLPFCPYIASWIQKHPDYASLVPADRRGEFGL